MMELCVLAGCHLEVAGWRVWGSVDWTEGGASEGCRLVQVGMRGHGMVWRDSGEWMWEVVEQPEGGRREKAREKR